jgi:Spy/CpxP family protein refolding chaperone
MIAAAFAALTAGTTVQAQRGGQMGPGRGGMMMDQMLFKGITLTGVQKAKLDSLRQSFRTSMEAQRGQGRPEMAAIREARQKGDTATANKLMAEQRAKMSAQQDAHVATVRTILTPDQQKQFDANVAEMKKHQGEWGPGHRMGPPGSARKPQL